MILMNIPNTPVPYVTYHDLEGFGFLCYRYTMKILLRRKSESAHEREHVRLIPKHKLDFGNRYIIFIKTHF
jgi:hypothetical protein